uniref:Hexosyltransferase n=1 Tax=Moina brachiata TaxID=675436 RepID=A0A4Y7NKE3_9CRUS|nr:EOG090X07IA [Moina brachiata]SVE93056.1 EOG090X07IA [Moina brachiata]
MSNDYSNGSAGGNIQELSLLSNKVLVVAYLSSMGHYSLKRCRLCYIKIKRCLDIFHGIRSVWILRLTLLSCALLFMLVMGFFTHPFEKNYYTEFSYPINEDVQPYIQQLKAGEQPSLEPLNTFHYNYMKPCNDKCRANKEPVLVIMVKSAMQNFENRLAIRETWGKEHHFEDGDILSVFLLGNSSDEQLQTEVDNENLLYNDIVQSDFHDAYDNNTLKTMSGFRWVFDFCPNARYIFFADDDMYVSVRNLLTFLKNPSMYALPGRNLIYRISESRKQIANPNESTTENLAMAVKDLKTNDSSGSHLYAGYVFRSSPLRHWVSKWYVSLEEYPYHLWPPYATAGAYVVSRQALMDLFYASHYTKLFRFDDVFIGLACLKANIEPLHSSHFYFWKKPYSLEGYREVIASHGYGDPKELRFVWNQQKNAGRA